MNLTDVLDRFMLITSLDIEEASRWTWVCRDAMHLLEKSLKENADASEYGQRLSCAAAALAAYKLALYRECGDGVSSFKAGDISINRQSQTETAYKLWQKEKEDIGFLLNDDYFLFRRVK